MSMTPYLLRFDAEDQKHRRLLEAHFRKLHGRPVVFADILRKLMAEKVSEFCAEKPQRKTLPPLPENPRK